VEIVGEARERFSEEITPASSEALLERMSEHARNGIERVLLDVSSPGGEVASAMRLHRALLDTNFELVTRNVGEVASMGNLVFLAGDKRLALPGTTFLLHPVTFKESGLDLEGLSRYRQRVERTGRQLSRLLELDRGVARLEREESEIHDIIERRSKLSRPAIVRLVRESKPLDPEFAHSAGIVHGLAPAFGKAAPAPLSASRPVDIL
jgi:ATP-dependent protease ClpP protease subunit